MANLEETKRLNNDQYDRATELAVERVMSMNQEPTRSDFEEDYDRVWRLEDLPILILFVVLFFISGVHVFTTIGEIAAGVYDAHLIENGIHLRRHAFVVAHQVAFTMLAEFSLLGFMILLGLKPAYVNSEGVRVDPIGFWKRLTFLALVAASMCFTVWANAESGLPLLIAVFVPAITIGVGFYIEQKVVDVTIRRRRLERDYRKAINEYKATRQAPENHPEWKKIWYNEIYQKLMGLKQNREWADQFPGDVPAELKAAIVLREIDGRENWIDVEPVDITEIKNVTSTGKTAEGVRDFILENNLWDKEKQDMTVTYKELLKMMDGGSNSTIRDAKQLLRQEVGS